MSSPRINSDSDVQLVSSVRKRRKIVHVSSDEEPSVTPKRRSTTQVSSGEEEDDRGKGTSASEPDSDVAPLSTKFETAASRQQEDLDEDMEFLGDAESKLWLTKSSRWSFVC